MNLRQHSLTWLLGFVLAVSMMPDAGAQTNPPQVSINVDLSQIRVITYANGLTGFFVPATGMLFLYDANLENCISIRQITSLGEPMKRLKN